MADALNSRQGRPGASILRKLSIAAVVLLALLVAAYFAVTSSAFLKSFVLPRLAQAVGADITVAEVSLSPFSQLILRKAQVRTTGTEPLLVAEEIKARYDLFAMLRGNIDVQEVSLVGPQVHLMTDAVGKSNWAPLLAKGGTPSAEPAKPLRLNIRNVNLKNGKVRLTTRQKDGAAQTIDLENLNLTVDQLRNAGSSKATLTSDIKFEQSARGGPGSVVDRAQAKLSAEFDLGLDAELKPGSIKGSGRIDLANAEGAFKDLGGLGAAFQTDFTLSEIKQLAVRFERGGKSLGSILANGPFNLETLDARLKLEIQSIDRQVLNVFGATRGWDFGDSVLNASGTVESSQKGAALASSGVLTGHRVSIRQSTGVTPPLDVNLEYQMNLNFERKAGSIEKLILSGQENQKPLLQASLDRPMRLNWGTAQASIPDSTLKLTLQDFNLQSWRPLIGTNVPDGRVNLQWTLQAQQDGKKLSAKLTGNIQELTAKIGTDMLEKAQARFDVSGQIENLQIVDVNPYRVELLIGNQVAASSHGTMRADLSKNELSLKSDSEASIPDLLKPFSVPGLKATRGQLKSSSTFTQSGSRQAAAGQLQLIGFSGGFGTYDFREFQTTVDYGVEIAGNDVQLQRIHATFGQNGQPGGSAEFSGRYHLTNQAAQIAFKLASVDQTVLRPLLASSLGENRLVSVAVNGSGSASFDPKQGSAVKAELKVANLVIEDPLKKLPRTPLSAEFQLDGLNRQQTVELRQFTLKLSPTDRAQNQLRLQGRLDLSPSNATPSQITVEADSLDLTPYYDLFAGTGGTNQPASIPPAASTSEPSPIHLPLQQLTANLRVARCYLRDLALTNLQATAKINRDEITLQPLQFALNGAPVNARAVLNLGVPGFRYEVSLKADKIPLEPLASSFGGKSGRVLQGSLVADAQIKGAGITGTSLQKNLSGQVTLSLTNLNLEIVGKKTRGLLEPIALVLRVPELTLTPLEWVSAKADVAQGKINVSQFSVLSQAFFADGRGVVQIAPALNDSPIDIPVAISLRRSLAEKARLMPAGTPPDKAYVQLPTFAKLTGTLGAPKTETDKLVISGLLIQSASSIPNVNEKTGKILQGLGGILSGQRPALPATNAPLATNSISGSRTNKPGRFNPLDLLELVPKKK